MKNAEVNAAYTDITGYDDDCPMIQRAAYAGPLLY